MLTANQHDEEAGARKPPNSQTLDGSDTMTDVVSPLARTGRRPGMNGDVHIVFSDQEWHVKLEGQGDPLSTHDTQEEAVEIGREAARAAQRELLVHGKDGAVVSRDSHGHDPSHRPG